MMSATMFAMIDTLHNMASGLALISQFSKTLQNGLQSFYDWYNPLWGESQFNFDVFGASALALIVFWTLGILFTILDLTKWPNFLYQYKTQDKSVTWQEVTKTAKVALLNQLTVQMATTIMFHYLMKYRGMDQSKIVPTMTTLLVHIFMFAIIQEITFYYAHRLLHRGIFYKAIHKIHHYWQAPIAISAIYCHPIEHVVANLFPVLLGPLIMGSHRSVIAVWLVIVHWITLNDHSGYHFPLAPSPEFHDYHHMMFNQNFGRMGFLDWFHGTSDRFVKSKHSKRDKLLLGITPLRKSVPDN